jgi:hypothetical protein
MRCLQRQVLLAPLEELYQLKVSRAIFHNLTWFHQDAPEGRESGAGEMDRMRRSATAQPLNFLRHASSAIRLSELTLLSRRIDGGLLCTVV